MKKQNSHDTTASFLEEAPIKVSGGGAKKNVTSKEYTVVKRNGTLVPFRRERILSAIEAAFRDTKKSETIDTELQQSIGQITDLVVKQVLNLASKGACLTVEGIQDVVEVTLMKNGHHDVARDYIIYRDSRKIKRDGSPQNLKIYRRDKTTPARFNPMKIASSIERAFRRARKIEDQTTDEVVSAVNLLTQKIVGEMAELAAKGDLLYIDMIEDRMERELMSDKYFDVAKQYILYRAEKAKNQESTHSTIDENAPVRQFEITTIDNGRMTITETMLRSKLGYACKKD